MKLLFERLALLLDSLNGRNDNMAMRKRLGTTLTALVVGIVAVVIPVWLACSPDELRPEPVYNGRPLRDWLKELSGFDVAEMHKARDVLAGIDTNAIPDLIRMLKLKDPKSKSDIHLVGNWICRWNAAYVLGRFGSQAEPAIPHLVKLLNDRIPEVRYYSAGALGNIGPEARSAIPRLLTLKASDQNAAAFADWAIEEIQSKPHSDATLKAMTSATASEDGGIAEPAVVILRDRGLACLALPSLLAALADTEWLYSVKAVYAADRIAMIGPQASDAVGPLTAALSRPHALLRVSAVRALGEIGPRAKAALPTLVAMSSGSDGKDWQGMSDEFWRGTLKRAVQQIDPKLATSEAVK